MTHALKYDYFKNKKAVGFGFRLDSILFSQKKKELNSILVFTKKKD